MKSSSYSMVNVVAMLDGLQVIGLWDGDDAISVAIGADVGSGMVGADGSSIFSQTADRSAAITLKLQHTSPVHRQLMQKWAQQKAGRLLGFPFTVKELQSGEGGAADQCFVQKAPNDQKGNKSTTRDWVIWTGDWEPLIPNA